MKVFKRILSIIVIILIIIICVYFIGSCSLINSTSLYIESFVGNTYQNREASTTIVINDGQTANMTVIKNDETKEFFLQLNKKGNLLEYATSEESAENKHFIFIPLSDDRLYCQSNNEILYNINYLLEQEVNYEAE